MKKYLMCLFLACVVLPPASQAQGKRAMCVERCMEDAINAERQQAHEAKIRKIQARKAAETDPQIIKQLVEQEEEEQEKYLAARDKVCKRICGAFSE